jgi:hypothetical protein
MEETVFEPSNETYPRARELTEPFKKDWFPKRYVSFRDELAKDRVPNSNCPGPLFES